MHWEGAFRLLQVMMHELLIQNVVDFGVDMSACEKDVHWEGAFRLLQEMMH